MTNSNPGSEGTDDSVTGLSRHDLEWIEILKLTASAFVSLSVASSRRSTNPWRSKPCLKTPGTVGREALVTVARSTLKGSWPF